MSNTTSLETEFQIGVLKELHKRQLITRAELDKAIKAVKGKQETKLKQLH